MIWDSIDLISDNCYPGTSVLINKFDIRDEAKLNEVETFDCAHYKAIHYFLFSDLYDWAGQVRTVNISKKGTRFTLAENSERQAELIFEQLKDCN